MPLPHHSQSHGRLAFGFFNIETDLLLLQRDFFFADAFCDALIAALAPKGPASVSMEAWRIDTPRALGDLHGAIAGQALHGFIGATYRRWPFPAAEADFKQNPAGQGTQDEVRRLIAPFATSGERPLSWQADTRELSLGEYRFDGPQALALVAYVGRGGYPRWRDDQPPDYVRRLLDSDPGRALAPPAR